MKRAWEISVTSWQGTTPDAEHYYAELHEPWEKPSMQYGPDAVPGVDHPRSWHLERPMDARDTAKMNKRNRQYGHYTLFKVGTPTRGFWDKEGIVESAMRVFEAEAKKGDRLAWSAMSAFYYFPELGRKRIIAVKK